MPSKLITLTLGVHYFVEKADYQVNLGLLIGINGKLRKRMSDLIYDHSNQISFRLRNDH
jgi:hypothetical protein